MATGGADKVVKLWDPATGANTGSLRVCFYYSVDLTHAAFANLPVACCLCLCPVPVACCLLPLASCLLPVACDSVQA